jgi:hypothetical protein
VRSERTCRLDGVEVLSHDPAGLAQHWSHLLGVPALGSGGRHVIPVDAQNIAISAVPALARERLDAMVLTVRGAAGILGRARQMGLETRPDGFALCGVWMKLLEQVT